MTSLGPTGFGPLAGLAYDSANDVLYGCEAGGGAGRLVACDRASGTCAAVGALGFGACSALELGPDGTLYAGLGGSESGSLITVDPLTGAGTIVGDTGFGGLSGLAFVPPVGVCLDGDGDGRGSEGHPGCPQGATVDCDDTNAGSWATPTATRDLIFENRELMRWSPPDEPGAIQPLYDTLRSSNLQLFGSIATCVETDGTDTETIDSSAPRRGVAFYYLTRAESECSDGAGPLGSASDGTPRAGPVCD